MDLRTKHILAVSVVAGVAGTIGYLLGRKHKVEPELEQKIYITDLHSPMMKKTLKELCSTSEKWDYFETESGSGIRSSVLPVLVQNPEWSELTKDDISFMKKRARGKIADKFIWDELDTKQYHNTVENYISKEEDDEDEDPENLRTQGEVEYTSTEPYIVPEDEVFIDGNDPGDIETLVYYKKDGVLTDSFDEIVESKQEIIGDIALKLVQDNTVYIRNPITKRDYEIALVENSYEQEVLGADEEQYQNAVKFFKLGDE